MNRSMGVLQEADEYRVWLKEEGRYLKPSLDEPEPGESCPQCAEPLRLVAYCGACGWRGDQ